VDPVPDPLLFFGSAWNGTRASGSVAKNSVRRGIHTKYVTILLLLLLLKLVISVDIASRLSRNLGSVLGRKKRRFPLVRPAQYTLRTGGCFHDDLR
jgi:hypothetical protein